MAQGDRWTGTVRTGENGQLLCHRYRALFDYSLFRATFPHCPRTRRRNGVGGVIADVQVEPAQVRGSPRPGAPVGRLEGCAGQVRRALPGLLRGGDEKVRGAALGDGLCCCICTRASFCFLWRCIFPCPTLLCLGWALRFFWAALYVCFFPCPTLSLPWVGSLVLGCHCCCTRQERGAFNCS